MLGYEVTNIRRLRNGKVTKWPDTTTLQYYKYKGGQFMSQ